MSASAKGAQASVVAPGRLAEFLAFNLADPILVCGCSGCEAAADIGGGRKGSDGKTAGGSKNVAPTARADAFTSAEDQAITLNVLANDSDKNRDALTITHVAGQAIEVGQMVTLASGATVTLNADMTLSYDPGGAWTALNAGQTALESFAYSISDGRGGTASATVSLTIEGVGGGANRAPVARSDSLSTDERTAAGGNVLANDSDPDGDALVVSAVNGSATAVGQTITLASGAKLTLRADGSYVYDPNGAFNALNAGQTGSDSFSYTVSDGRGGVASTTVSVAIAGMSETTTPYYVLDLLASDSQRWNAGKDYGTPVTVTFTFLDSVPDYYLSSDWQRIDFRSFSDAQKQATRKALGDISGYANIDFVETADISKAAITFGIADHPSALGSAFYPSGTGINRKAGDVWIDSAYAGSTFTEGSAQYKTLVHEIGHAIGLSHPSALTGAENTRQYTVMSYTKYSGIAADASTHMLYDVATVQHLYGANRAAKAGNDVYRSADLANKLTTVWDAGGSDTFDFRDMSANLMIDLREGKFSTVATSGRGNVAIAFGTTIENAVGGSGADVLIGNAADNVLTGGAGRDTFRFHDGWGDDIISDFTRGADVIDVSACVGRFADLTIRQADVGVIVARGEDTILLAGVAAVEAGDFLFGALA